MTSRSWARSFLMNVPCRATGALHPHCTTRVSRWRAGLHGREQGARVLQTPPNSPFRCGDGARGRACIMLHPLSCGCSMRSDRYPAFIKARCQRCAPHARCPATLRRARPGSANRAAARGGAGTGVRCVAGFHGLAVLLQDLAYGGRVEADKGQEARDVLGGRLERAQRAVQLRQLRAGRLRCGGVLGGAAVHAGQALSYSASVTGPHPGQSMATAHQAPNQVWLQARQQLPPQRVTYSHKQSGNTAYAAAHTCWLLLLFPTLVLCPATPCA